MTWLGVALIGVGGFLIGGVLSSWRNDNRVLAVILGIFSAACLVGGVLWLLPS